MRIDKGEIIGLVSMGNEAFFATLAEDVKDIKMAEKILVTKFTPVQMGMQRDGQMGVSFGWAFPVREQEIFFEQYKMINTNDFMIVTSSQIPQELREGYTQVTSGIAIIPASKTPTLKLVKD